MNPLPECCFPNSAPIPHQFVMKVYVDAWIYVTEKFVNVGNIELYEEISRYEKADYPPIPNFIFFLSLSGTPVFWGHSAFLCILVAPHLLPFYARFPAFGCGSDALHIRIKLSDATIKYSIEKTDFQSEEEKFRRGDFLRKRMDLPL